VVGSQASLSLLVREFALDLMGNCGTTQFEHTPKLRAADCKTPSKPYGIHRKTSKREVSRSNEAFKEHEQLQYVPKTPQYTITTLYLPI